MIISYLSIPIYMLYSIWYQESSLDTAKRTRELISCSMVLSAVRKDQYRSEADIHDHTPRDVAVGQLI